MPTVFRSLAFLNLGNLAVDAFPASNILTSSNGGQIFQVVSVWYSLILLVRPAVFLFFFFFFFFEKRVVKT